MAGGFCIDWTAWRVWLHPKRALRSLMEASDVETDLRNRLEETIVLLEQQRKETAIQTFNVSELSRRLVEVEKSLAEKHHELELSRIELTRTLDSLDEHKEAVKEFDEAFKKVETMKRNYEKRITELEARLGNALKRLGKADDNELRESIDMLENKRRDDLFHQRREQRAQARHQAEQTKSPVSRTTVPSYSPFRDLSAAASYTPDSSPYDKPSPKPSDQDSTSSEQISSSGHTVSQATAPSIDFTNPAASSHDSPSAADSNSSDAPKPEATYVAPQSSDKISGKPGEVSEKVADYLRALHAQTTNHKRRGGRSYDDWLSTPPDL